ncbi:MAG: AmmeMemoRadiSam system protein A [Treponema sp.]|jgi:AmmeMemoRadiSam system protein A/AmmeMemoRadiSam system protein B|nr:AmmeMemoRadiSam system protein A [Treponema sp.]
MRKSFLVPHPPLIVPGVGKGGEIPDTRNAYRHIAEEIKREKPETVIIISPHSVCYTDYFHISPGISASGDFGMFRAPHIKFSVEYDEELAELIGRTAEKDGISAGSLGERNPELDHGVMVPLYFLEARKIVRIGLSGFSLSDHYRFGMSIRSAVDKLRPSAILVASGDMSHKLKAEGPYGLVKEGPEHDAFVRNCMETADFRKLLSIDNAVRERAAECGFRSLVILAGYMDGVQTQSRVLSYEAPFGVGYLTVEFFGAEQVPSLLPAVLGDRDTRLASSRSSKNPYVRLAIDNIEHFVKTGKTISSPSELPEEMLRNRAGVFVSIKKEGVLRGCIGTISPVQKNIAQEIIKNSISAASRDPRFSPIKKEELPLLSYSVDILFPSEPISHSDELDVKRYGLIVSCGNRRGLLLPNLDGVDSVEEQITIALQKGGIHPSEPYTMERFEVIRHT